MISRPASPIATVAPMVRAPTAISRVVPSRASRGADTSDGRYIATTCACTTRAVSSMEYPSTTCMLSGVAVMTNTMAPCPTTAAAMATRKRGCATTLGSGRGGNASPSARSAATLRKPSSTAAPTT